MKGRFYVVGKEKPSVTGVGCRIKAYREILEDPSLKNGIARNVDNNKVEILVEADGVNAKEALEDFRKKIMMLELPNVSANPGFYVTDLDISEAVQALSLPSVERTSSSLTLEQLDKAVGAFLGMKSDMHDMKSDITGMRFDITGMRSDISALPSRFAEEMAKLLKNR